jgi:hypothetical protein
MLDVGNGSSVHISKRNASNLGPSCHQVLQCQRNLKVFTFAALFDGHVNFEPLADADADAAIR